MKTKNSNIKASIYGKLNLEKETKIKFDKLLSEINKNSGLKKKVAPNSLQSYLIELFAKDHDQHKKTLQLSSLTWIEEEERLRPVWENKNRKVSKEQWELLKCTGQLVGFFKEHSRIPLDKTC